MELILIFWTFLSTARQNINFFLIGLIRKMWKTLQVNRNRKIFIVAVIKATSSVAFITRKNWDLGSIFSHETVRSAGVRLPWKFFCFYLLFVCPIKETFPSSIVEWDSQKRGSCDPLLHSEKSNFISLTVIRYVL